jgi:hypothetical protein
MSVKVMRTAVISLCLRIVPAVILATGCTAYAAFAGQNDRVVAAQTAALNWLAQVDAGVYDDAWQQATGLIRRRTQANWTDWMQERRGGLGGLLQRTTVYAKPRRASAGEPEGEYIEIEYDTDFSGLSHLFEYVRTLRGEDGVWRVCWYFVRQRSAAELSHVDGSQ